MKGIIIYKSKYGSTKQYAEWLQADTGFALYDYKHCPADLSGYDLVVLGSSVCAGRLSLRSWMLQHWPVLQGKTVYLLMTNITADAEVLAKVVPQSLPPEMVERVKVFPVGGRYLLAQMSFIDRTLIKMVSSIEKRPEIKQELLQDRDWVKQENLREILDRLRETSAAIQ